MKKYEESKEILNEIENNQHPSNLLKKNGK